MSGFYLSNPEEASTFHELNHWADNMSADPQESLDEICQSCFHWVRSWEVFCSRCGTMSTTFALFPPAAALNPGTQTVVATTPVPESGDAVLATNEALGHGDVTGTIAVDNALLQEAMGLLDSLATMPPLFGTQTVPAQVPVNTGDSVLDTEDFDYELQAELEAKLFSEEPELDTVTVHGDVLADSSSGATPLVPETPTGSHEASEVLPSSFSQIPQDSAQGTYEDNMFDSDDLSDDGSLFDGSDCNSIASPPAAFVELALPTGSRQILGERNVPNSCTSDLEEKFISPDVSRENAENVNPTQTVPDQEEPVQFYDIDSGHAEWEWQGYHEGNSSHSHEMSGFQQTGDFNPSELLHNSYPAALVSPANYHLDHSELVTVEGASTAPSTSRRGKVTELEVSREITVLEDQERSDALPDGRVIQTKFKNTSTASSRARAKGKGKARQDVSNDERTTPPSLEHFTFTFVLDRPFAASGSNDDGSEPGPSTAVLGKGEKIPRTPKFPKSAETLGIGKIIACPYSGCKEQLTAESASEHLREHINSTRDGRCPKEGCSHSEKSNILRTAEHIIAKHMDIRFPCVIPQCNGTATRKDLLIRHRNYTCHYCIFCGDNTKFAGSVRLAHERGCKFATDEQKRRYFQELAESNKKKKTRRENKEQKEPSKRRRRRKQE